MPMRDKRVSIFTVIFICVIMIFGNLTSAFADTENTTNSPSVDGKEDLLRSVEQATEEYENARKVYNEAPLKFLEERCPTYTYKEKKEDYYYLENQLTHLKDSSNNVLNRAYKEEVEHIKEHFSFKLLRGEADLLDQCNKRRASDTNFTEKENNAPLKLAPELVLTAMVDSMVLYSSPNEYHVLVKYHDRDAAIWDTVCGNMQGVSNRTNPFRGWYDEELIKYNNGVRDRSEIGHYEDTMKKYGGYRFIKTWEEDPEHPGEEWPVTNKVHYDGRVGFGVYYDKELKQKGQETMYTYSAVLGPYNAYNDGENLYTSDEWRKAVDEYEAPLKERLDAAEKALKEAKEAAGITDDKDNTGKEDGNNPGGNTGKEDTDKPGSGDSGKDNPSTPNEKPEVKYTTIDSIKLSTTKYTYDGKAKLPAVSVYANGKKMDKTGYTVRYSSGRKNIGTYTVNVTGIQENGYTGSKNAAFQIVPKTMKAPSVKAGKKKVTIKWAKVSGGVKYQIAIAKKGSKSKYYSVSGSKKTINKLSKRKKYTIRVRAYKKVGSKTYYGGWSKTKTVKVK